MKLALNLILSDIKKALKSLKFNSENKSVFQERVTNVIYSFFMGSQKTSHDWCASFRFSLPINKRTTQPLSVFPIHVPRGSALMWMKWRIITVRKDGHLPTVPGFNCIFSSFWWYLSALKEEKEEEAKVQKGGLNFFFSHKPHFQSLFRALVWT